MIINKNITEFKRRFEKIYKNMADRLNPGLWKDTVAAAHSEDAGAAAAAVLDFVQANGNLPSGILKILLHESDIRNHPAPLAEIYSLKVLLSTHDASVREDIIDCANLPAGLSDEQLRAVMDTAEKAQKYLRRGQVYLAEQAVSSLSEMISSNPDLDRLQNALGELRATGGIPRELFSEKRSIGNDRTDSENTARSLEQAGRLKEAAACYEKIISADYENYNAYSHLGFLYLKTGEPERADYIADLLLELGILEGRSRVLKGRILEKRGQTEDALYYYVTACLKDPSSVEAFNERRRLISQLDGSGEHLFTDVKEDQLRMETDENDGSDLSGLSVNESVASVIRESDALLARGRVSEAYYELSKASEKHPEVSVLTFKKAFALYMMKREPEARDVLRTIGRTDVLRRRAEWLIEDIDYNMIDRGRFEEIPVTAAAEILFEAGQYDVALAEINRADLSSMDAQAWALKGRCEIENNNLDQALRSFQNAVDRDYHIEGVREMMAMIYYVRGDLEKADEMYNQAIKLSGNPKEICETKAGLLYSQGMKSRLLEFRKSSFALLGRASDVDGYCGLAILDSDPGSREAAGYVESAILAGSTVEAFYRAAYKIYISQRLFYRALICAEQGICLVKDPSDLYFLKACALFRLGKLDSAETVSGILLASDAGDARILYLMGRISEVRGDTGSALKWMLDAAEKDPDSHEYAFAIAEMYFHRKEYQKALPFYTKALMLDSGDSTSLKRRAFIYSRDNNDSRALEDINCALLLTPDDPDLYILIGNIISGYAVEEYDDMDLDVEGAAGESGEPAAGAKPAEASGTAEEAGTEEEDTAETPERTYPEKNTAGYDFLNDTEKGPEYYYSRAIELAPDNAEGYMCRAKYYADQGRLEEALADAGKALSLDPDSARPYMLRGTIRMLAGMAAEAVTDFREAADLEPGNVLAYSYIARCCNSLERYEEALAAAEHGLESDSGFVNLYINRGVAYYHLGKYAEAVQDFSRVLERRNEVNTSALETVYRFRGMAYEGMHETQKALSDYRTLLRYNPESAGIRERIQALSQRTEAGKSKSFFSRFRRKTDK